MNNESISWDATMLRNLAAASEHFVWLNFSGFLSSPTAHFVETGARFNVYRAGAVHYGEGLPLGLPQYVVKGHHWLNINRYRSIYRQTRAFDCSLQDGFVQWGS